jgi:hypothetical protein
MISNTKKSQQDILLNAFKLRPSAIEKKFNFIENNKDTLLITIGDSWTVGGSFEYLIEPNVTDLNDPILRKFQLDNVYGNTLRQYLDADWYNIALSAESNRWIANQFREFSRIRNQLTYKKIYIVITLTEVGREWRDIKFLKSTTNSNIVKLFEPIANSITSLDEYVFKTSALIEEIILSATSNDINLIVGRNYVDDSYPNLTKFMLPDNWLDVLSEPQHKSTKQCYMVGSIAFDPLVEVSSDFTNITRKDFLSMMSNYIDLSSKRIDQLLRSKHNIHKLGYQHPTPTGHKLWADYIFEYINNRKLYT